MGKIWIGNVAHSEGNRPRHRSQAPREERMKLIIVLCALLVSGCADYKCVNGIVYNKLYPFNDIYVESYLYKDAHCKDIK